MTSTTDRHPQIAELELLLARLFTPPQLRRFIARQHGERMLRQVSEETQDAAALAREAVGLLARAGQLDEQLFLALIAARPRQRERIEVVAQGLGAMLTESAVLAAATRPPRETEAATQAVYERLLAQRALVRQLLDGPVKALTSAWIKGEAERTATSTVWDLANDGPVTIILCDLWEAVLFFGGLGPHTAMTEDGTLRYDEATSVRWATSLATLRQIGQLTNIELRRLATVCPTGE